MKPTPITQQQAFDAALFGIRDQQYARSRSINGGCMYRGSEGRKCGIGLALPDELCVLDGVSIDRAHTDKLSGPGNATIGTLLRDAHWGPHLSPFFEHCSLSFLTGLQQAHDSGLHSGIHTTPAGIRANFEARMARIAKEYGLTYTPPELT